MAYKKRYRKAEDEDEPKGKKYHGKKHEEEDEDEDEEEDRPRRKKHGRGRDGDSPFVRVTGLFKGKNRGTYHVFLKDEDGEPDEQIIDKLKDAIKEGKMLGVSIRDEGTSLWYVKDDED